MKGEEWSGLAIVGTALAVAIATLSLAMPWYVVSHTSPDGVNTTKITMYDDYYSSSRGLVRFYDNTFENTMGGFMDSLSWLIIIWALYGVVYIASCVIGGNVIIRGSILQILCVVPVVFFVAGVVNAVNSLDCIYYDIDGLFGHIDAHPFDGNGLSWGPEMGFVALLSASIIQFIVVTVRSAPILARTLSNWSERRSAGDDSEGE